MRLFILLLLVSANTFAQPSFQQNHCFQVGDSNRIALATMLRSLDTEVQFTGTNYTWDYSLQLWANPQNPYIFQSASSSIHTTFANSQINELGGAVFTRDLFYSYSTDLDTLYWDGVYTSISSKYNPSIPYLSFPLSYGDTGKTYLKQYANPNQPNFATGSVTRYWTYDGYGTVNLGFAIIPDVYRIHTKQTDSLYLVQFDNTIEELVYFRSTDGVPILRLVRNEPFITAYYGSAMNASGINTTNSTHRQFNVFPNPSTGIITVDSKRLHSSSNYEIYTIQGQRKASGSLYNGKIDLSDLENGIYLLKIGEQYSKISIQK